MRLATYNVENLFDRAKVMNLDSWEEGRKVLDNFAKLNALLGEVKYTAAAKKKMAALLDALGLKKADKSKFVILRRNKGRLLKRPKTGPVEIIADGRVDWAGSLELIEEPVAEGAMQMTARVMRDVKADVLAVVEAESRPVLAEFISDVLPGLGGNPFRHVMLIDGNDERGIDVGLATGKNFAIGELRSHVDDRGADGKPVFSRDCPEYAIETPDGNRLLVMVNHFKSKGFGTPAESNARRKRQAAQVKKIYEERIAEGNELIAIVGDLNDTPASDPLSPLIDDTDLKDAFEHPTFDDGGFPGTFGLCNASNKIDYALLSPKLFARVKVGGVFRTGMWAGSRPPRWKMYPELKRPEDAGSDHAAVWVDVDV